MMYNREMRCKLPQLPINDIDPVIRQTESTIKLKQKQRADADRKVKHHAINTRELILIRVEKTHKKHITL